MAVLSIQYDHWAQGSSSVCISQRKKLPKRGPSAAETGASTLAQTAQGAGRAKYASPERA